MRRFYKDQPAYIEFDKSVADPRNIVGDINSGSISKILSKFRRCLCKSIGGGSYLLLKIG